MYRARIVSIGARARAALERSAGVARPLKEFPDAPYYEADGEVVWIGDRLVAMHPRAVLTQAPVPSGREILFADLPDSCGTRRASAGDVISREHALGAQASIRKIARELPAHGFGCLLTGQAPPFPLALAATPVMHMARAFTDDDPDAMLSASMRLLGVGSGLTPSGDDLVGAAFFAHRYTATHDTRWSHSGECLLRHSAVATHRISAALFRDLMEGESFAPLHEIVNAMPLGDQIMIEQAVRSLAKIGHSSGWDMLTGLLIGLLGQDAGFQQHDFA